MEMPKEKHYDENIVHEWKLLSQTTNIVPLYDTL